ncbi:MAG: ATP-binding protein [Myxococcota bacterium]
MTKEPSPERTRRPGARTLLAVGEATGGVSHDVGNALTAIAARAALIRAEAGRPDMEEHAEAILRAARSAGEVLDRVRRLLRPADRRDLVRVEPAAVVDEAVDTVRERARSAGCRLDVDARPCPAVAGIPGELVHLLVNLATNAIDAAGAGGEVRVRAEATHAGVLLEVLDDGPGIPDDLAARARDPFVSTKGSGGMGLGLALCRRIAELHDADLVLERRPGGGTRAAVRLPPADAGIPAPRRATSLELAAIREPLRVLVIDDDEDAREALCALLDASGLRTASADGVASAWTLLDSFDPAVVITDLAMGDRRSGWDLLRSLKTRDALLPVLVTTGDASAVEDPAASQAEAVLVKPVNPGSLVARVREVAERRAGWVRVLRRGDGT